MVSHYNMIIVPVDGSEGAARAAVFAADLARATARSSFCTCSPRPATS